MILNFAGSGYIYTENDVAILSLKINQFAQTQIKHKTKKKKMWRTLKEKIQTARNQLSKCQTGSFSATYIDTESLCQIL